MNRDAGARTVVAALIWRDKHLLICQRRRDDAFPLKWEFPGGKLEPNEDPHAGLERELMEELGIRASIAEEVWRTVYQYTGRAPVRLLFYQVREFEGNVENRVFEQVRWTLPGELGSYDFLEADRPLITRLAAGELRPSR